MPALPLSVRFALWATVAVRGEMDPDDAVVAAHPDVDDITGEPAGRLELWRDFGESAVLVAHPRPGDLTGMPRAELAGSGDDKVINCTVAVVINARDAWLTVWARGPVVVICLVP